MTFMQIILFIGGALFLLWAMLQCYLFGRADRCKERVTKTCKECYEDGYAKGREEVNAHLDAYRKNGGWSV